MPPILLTCRIIYNVLDAVYQEFPGYLAEA